MEKAVKYSDITKKRCGKTVDYNPHFIHISTWSQTGEKLFTAGPPVVYRFYTMKLVTFLENHQYINFIQDYPEIHSHRNTFSFDYPRNGT